jgi:hypothetical protein
MPPEMRASFARHARELCCADNGIEVPRLALNLSVSCPGSLPLMPLDEPDDCGRVAVAESRDIGQRRDALFKRTGRERQVRLGERTSASNVGGFRAACSRVLDAMRLKINLARSSQRVQTVYCLCIEGTTNG